MSPHTVHSEGLFSEKGNITFGKPGDRTHTVFYEDLETRPAGVFVTLNPGTVGGPIARTYVGRITGGTGAYKGVTGVISYSGIVRSYLPANNRFVSIVMDKNVTKANKH